MTAYATSAEYATYSGAAEVTATATATLVGDAVGALAIGAGGGYGYVTTPNVVIAAPTTGVRATATATIANGVVTLLTITGGGSGYALPPAVTIDPPTGLTRLLLRASELIDDQLRTATYHVDALGMPTDADDIATFRDATCAQVEFWLAGDEEDDVLGPVDKIQIGSMKVEYSGFGGVRVAPLVLAPRAARILRNAQLYNVEAVEL